MHGLLLDLNDFLRDDFCSSARDGENDDFLHATQAKWVGSTGLDVWVLVVCMKDDIRRMGYDLGRAATILEAPMASTWLLDTRARLYWRSWTLSIS